MSFVIYLIAAAATFFVYKIFFHNKNKNYFAHKGIKYEKPRGLLAIIDMFTKKKSLPDVVMGWYNDFKSEKISGIFEFSRPVFMVRDPKLIKQMAVKDFDYFMDHRVVLTEEIDELFGKSLISLQGQKWKDMRSTLSPAFTGHKMRLMFDFVASVGKQTVETLKCQIDEGREKDFEFKELATKFTVDNIASCAFGIHVNSFADPKNDFHRIASELTSSESLTVMLKFTGLLLFPWLMKAFKISFFSENIMKFFKEAILDTMKTREEKGIVRHDMINLLMQAKKGNLTHENEEKTVEGFATVEESQMGKMQNKRKWDDTDLAAQALVFFIAGFETVATTMAFMGYELAINPEIQKKLYEEILETEKELNGKPLTYEKIQTMKFMDQVVSEVLRKWPPSPVTDRICVKDYVLDYEGRKITIEKDRSFMIPIWAFHRDPNYYRNPEKFDPERFNDENRKNIQEYTYMPFGVGPRNCIGSRFALMEVKTIFYYLLLNFRIAKTDKTKIPLQFKSMSVGLKVKEGIWVALEPK
ncbi:hypothetical protein PVAND_009389 [Polypedilum vanderplanki]|uniref:Cytochrome P450 n=1 Tax=Polypedilum vanderplanki TaxID=319348 RepID=A0A9J6CCK9_POLVA|nr:hypothetical protein PVAND_009389 [Polypedilum vanderplanki]